MKRSIAALVLAVGLFGCSGKTKTKTERKTGGPTSQLPSPKPPKTLAETVIIPRGVSKGNQRNQAPPAFRTSPPAEEVIDQRFIREGKVRGGATLFAYDTKEDADACYAAILSGMTRTTDITDIGDRGKISTRNEIRKIGTSTIDISYSAICFQRGNIVVHVAFGWTGNPREIAPYAKRLDDRIAQMPSSRSTGGAVP